MLFICFNNWRVEVKIHFLIFIIRCGSSDFHFPTKKSCRQLYFLKLKEIYVIYLFQWLKGGSRKTQTILFWHVSKKLVLYVWIARRGPISNTSNIPHTLVLLMLEMKVCAFVKPDILMLCCYIDILIQYMTPLIG